MAPDNKFLGELFYREKDFRDAESRFGAFYRKNWKEVGQNIRKCGNSLEDTRVEQNLITLFGKNKPQNIQYLYYQITEGETLTYDQLVSVPMSKGLDKGLLNRYLEELPDDFDNESTYKYLKEKAERDLELYCFGLYYQDEQTGQERILFNMRFEVHNCSLLTQDSFVNSMRVLDKYQKRSNYDKSNFNL